MFIRGKFFEFIEDTAIPLVVEAPSKSAVGCACGSGIPVQAVTIEGEPVTLVALPPLMEQFRDAGKLPSPEVAQELLVQVALYNPIAPEDTPAYLEALASEYAAFCSEREAA